MARRTKAALLAAGVAVALAACSSGGGTANTGDSDGTPSGEITFTWWGNDERAAMFEQALDLFNQEYPDIKVVRNFSSWGDYWTARNTEAAGHSLPDVLMMDVGYQGEYADKDLFLDLSPYEGDELDTTGYSGTLLDSAKVDDKLIGLPLGSGVLSMMYNKDLLDGLGIGYPTDNMDWDDFIEWAQKVNDAGASVSPQLYGTDDYTGSLVQFMYHLMQNGQDVFTSDGQPAFSEDDVVEFLESADTPREDGTFFPIERTQALQPVGGFGSGEIATAINWTTTLSQIMADLGSENVGMVTPPMDPGTDTRVLSEKASMLLAVAANSKNPDAAVTLVNFLANSPDVAAIFGSSLGTPATQARRDAITKSTSDEVIDNYLTEVQDQISVTYPTLPSGYGSIESKWTELHEQLRYGDITDQEFADSLFSEMDLALNG